MFNGTLERAILETLAYSDVFDYPLRLEELHRYLPVCIEIDRLWTTLGSLNDLVGKRDDYYFLSGRDSIVDVRMHREAYSREPYRYALRYGRILGVMPFIRMVALTGSLAVKNSSDESDFDYMLVTAPGRVWVARVFALLFNRVTLLFGHTICPNLIVSESSLEWHRRDLYSARELCQMVPITGLDVYRRLMKANEWVGDFLPNAVVLASEDSNIPEIGWQNFLEIPLRGKLGDRIERWEMERKVARLSRQDGFGEETIFTSEICQGNFDHHRKGVQEAFQQRIKSLGKRSYLPEKDDLKVRV